MIFRSVLAGLTLSFFTLTSFADAPRQEITNKLKALLPEVVIKDVQKSPIQGFYQVQIDSGKVLYVSEDGQYLIQGYLFNLNGSKPKNLTVESEEKFVANLINGLDRSKMVIFPAKGDKPRAHITVFTDTTCLYCHKVHAEVPMLNAQGIEVRYLAFPREGLTSKGFDELQKVWCSDNKVETMNKFMKRIPVKSVKICKNPVLEQYVLGQKIGITGTPAIILQNGHIIAGYLPVNQLVNEALQAANATVKRD